VTSTREFAISDVRCADRTGLRPGYGVRVNWPRAVAQIRVSNPVTT
jgi:hypothetical protein